MKSINYTYEVKETGSGPFIFTHYFILGLGGEVVAEAKGEDNAVLIVAALNGIAP